MSDSPWNRTSLVGVVVAAMAVSIGTAAGLALVPVAGSFVGLFVGGFVAGMAIEDRPLLEAGVAGALANVGLLAASAGIGNGVVAAVAALGSIDPATLLVSIALGAAVGSFGAHFGDDLRDGLTEPVGDANTRVATPDHSSPVAESSVPQAADEADDHEQVAEERQTEEPAGPRDDVELERD
ncbi:YrzE family protein [Halobiforma nitratireducens]|uniref:DUF456 domain-containing protein n=1 Tax=Halobiforma nitratireducens JCM 10879 TaxID=1227454 RepID=M0M0C3_9EURY|nr:YrzE family protein [Halobiforma nitratireducens]EMA39121.1 hypothetical protein C446_09023 [Halobiforma nitratireducens JCM 10879]